MSTKTKYNDSGLVHIACKSGPPTNFISVLDLRILDTGAVICIRCHAALVITIFEPELLTSH